VHAPLQVGAEIVRRALSYPLRLIASNAGVNGSVCQQRVLESLDANIGYNAATDVYEDLMAAGIIDPTKVCAWLPCACMCQGARSFLGCCYCLHTLLPAEKQKGAHLFLEWCYVLLAVSGCALIGIKCCTSCSSWAWRKGCRACRRANKDMDVVSEQAFHVRLAQQ
jgi:hypothetical protein